MSLARPNGILTSGFDLVESGVPVATMEGSFWREGGVVRVRDEAWELRRHGWSSYRLVRGGVDEATARAVGFFKTSFEVRHTEQPARTYRLERRSAWRRGYALREDAVEVGSVEPTSVFTNAADVRLPDTLPLHVQVFVVGVVAIQWRRQQSTASSASFTG